MANFTAKRIIVQDGILKLSQANREVSQLRLYSQIEREPISPYKSYKRPVAESFYGYVQAFFRGALMWELPIKFPTQLVFGYDALDQIAFLSQICLHSYTYRVANRIANTLGLADDPELQPVDAELARLEYDYFAVKLLPGCTCILTAIGIYPPNDCEINISWREPAGLPKNNSNPLRPVPPDDVPVNPDDPNGFDKGDDPYDIPTKDDGLTYLPGDATGLKAYAWSGGLDNNSNGVPTGDFTYKFKTNKTPSLGAPPEGCPQFGQSLYLDGVFFGPFSSCDRLLGATLTQISLSDASDAPTI